jgi:hypothetical protein
MVHAKHLITIIAAASVSVLPLEALASYRYLCTSVPSACEYIPSPGQALRADVCWNGTAAHLKPSNSNCPTGQWPYYVEIGEVVDPITNKVQAYVPLDPACGMAGLCVTGQSGGGGTSSPICCDELWMCVPGTMCGGSLWWCYDGVSNMDGTVTCFDGEQV